MSWSYKRSITIDHTKVSGDQTDFPILVQLDSSNVGTTFKTVGNGGHIQNANGYDIYFYSDSALTTRIPAEREFYDGTNGVYLGWIKISSLSSSTDTVIYVAYDDSGISTDPNSDATYGKTQVWDANYQGVYHVPDGSTLSLTDSTSNGNDLTNSSATAVSGEIDGGMGLSGSQFAYKGTGLVTAPPCTLEAWVKSSSTSGVQPIITVQSAGSNANMIRTALYLSRVIAQSQGGGSGYASDTVNYSTTNWFHTAGVFTSSTSRTAYYNGGSAGSDTTTSSPTGINKTLAGKTENVDEFLTGSLDEIRISSVARSANWILTGYTNQNAPLSFHTIGTETAVGGGFQPAWAGGSNSLCF